MLDVRPQINNEQLGCVTSSVGKILTLCSKTILPIGCIQGNIKDLFSCVAIEFHKQKSH